MRRRGKSDIPEPRMEMEESRRESEERSEETDAVREARDWDCVFDDMEDVILCVYQERRVLLGLFELFGYELVFQS